MSQSKSLKADKELMWKKLKHVPLTDLEYFQKALMRGLRVGQLNTIAVGKGVGKTMCVDIESNG